MPVTRVELRSDTTLRCVDCDRWDLREAVLVDEDGSVLLRGSACPHCHRHRAESADDAGYIEGIDYAGSVVSPEERFTDFDEDAFDDRRTFAFRI